MNLIRSAKSFGLSVALLLASIALALVWTFASSAPNDRGFIADLLSRALSTPAARISIGEVSGALSSDVTIRNVTIADPDGVWLELDRVRLVWRRTALLFRRLEIDRLEVGNLALHRQPATPQEEAATVSAAPIFPELPLKVEVKAFSLAQLALGAPLLGTAARLGATGSASLGAPSEGLNLQLDARRLDAQGTFGARLSYVPATSRLDMTLALDEPAGGILVRALDLPGLPPARLDLKGGGTLEAFNAQLVLDAGPGLGANGAAQLARQGDGRQLTLDLAARIEGLLPEAARPVFSGETRLNGGVRFADDGGVAIKPVSVVSRLARMDINGTLSPERVADLTVAVRSVPNDGQKTSAGDVEIGSIVFDATVRGPIAGPQVAAKLALREASLPLGRLARLDANFEATPSGSVLEDNTAIPVTGRAEAEGIALRDPALARAVGSSFTLSLSGTARERVLDVTTLQLRAQTANASFAGRIGGPLVKGRATVEAPDLSRFRGVALPGLRGALALRADLDGVPDHGRIDAVLDGRATRFESGLSAMDGLAGGTVTLAGLVRMLPDGGFGFQDMRLDGAHASARVTGDATRKAAAIDVVAAIPDLRRADPRLSGRAEARGRLTGTLDRPDADAEITIANATALKRPIPRLTVNARATDITGALDARATLAGTVDGRDARGSAHLAKRAEGGWRINDLDLSVGSVAARGALTLDAASLADGRLTIDARNLDDLSPLVLTRLTGRLNADVVLTVANGGQGANIVAAGQGIRFGETAVDRLDARMAVTDVWRRPVIDGRIGIDRAVVGGETFAQIRLVSEGRPEASDLTLDALARGFAINARGRLVPADNIRLELAALTARRDPHRLVLANPATLTLLDGGIDIRNLALALDRGTIRIDGRAGSTLDLSVNARAVPLAAAGIVQPSLRLGGTLDAEAKVAGTMPAPDGSWRLSVARLTAPQTRDLGLPPIDIRANGRLAGGRTTLDATVSAQRAAELRIAGSVPLQDGALDLAVKGRVDLAAANAQLAAAGRRVTGRADIDMRIGGDRAQPRVTGAANLADGTYVDAALGVRLTAISGRLAARGEEIAVERLSARTANGGTLNASGQVRVDPAAGMPGTIRISGQRATLVSNDLVTMIASPALDLSGPLMRDPRIAGRIDIASMDVTVPERLPATQQPLPGTRHVAPPAHVRSVLAAQAAARARAGRTPAFDASLDLAISAPNRVFVRGRGIDAELGGELRLQGRMSSPSTVGAFELRRGRMQVAGTRLDFSRGRVSFTGEMTPELDFLAQTAAAGVTAQVAVTGPASEPAFALTSSPDMPQDEILSHILFSKASGSLSPFQALQLAQTAAQFAGAGGPDTFERMRRSLGVDTIDISTGRSGDPTVGVSRAINNRVSVGVKGGASTSDSGLTLDIDLTRRLRLQGAAYGSGDTSLGIGTEIEY